MFNPQVASLPPYAGAPMHPSAPPTPYPPGVYQQAMPQAGYYPPPAPGQPYGGQPYPPAGYGYPQQGVVVQQDRRGQDGNQDFLTACMAGLCAACACCCLLDAVD